MHRENPIYIVYTRIFLTQYQYGNTIAQACSPLYHAFASASIIWKGITTASASTIFYITWRFVIQLRLLHNNCVISVKKKKIHCHLSVVDLEWIGYCRNSLKLKIEKKKTMLWFLKKIVFCFMQIFFFVYQKVYNLYLSLFNHIPFVRFKIQKPSMNLSNWFSVEIRTYNDLFAYFVSPFI